MIQADGFTSITKTINLTGIGRDSRKGWIHYRAS